MGTISPCTGELGYPSFNNSYTLQYHYNSSSPYILSCTHVLRVAQNPMTLLCMYPLAHQIAYFLLPQLSSIIYLLIGLPSLAHLPSLVQTLWEAHYIHTLIGLLPNSLPQPTHLSHLLCLLMLTTTCTPELCPT